ncbi:major facilitator superfamily-domain-containing protein [Circinella umbellata]|nr:major facilitator superfamily-domain-containing protein [Circinella umbellata]
MKVLSRFRSIVLRSSDDTTKTNGSITEEKQLPPKEIDVDSVAASEKNSTTEEQVDDNVQKGVQAVEAVTLTWSKKTLIAVFINIWFLYFVNAFQSSILYNLLPYVTSEFSTHSLLNIIYIVASAISAAIYIPLAKVLDLWGRAEGFLIMVTFATLGLVMMAACNNLPTFCAAYVFYSIGFGGMIFSVDVITADASKLKNRGLAFAFTSSPYIITAFAGAKASEGFYENISWRWGFGAFSIIFPVVAAPLYFILKFNLRKAEKQGVLHKEKSNKTILQAVWYYFIEFDVVGVFVFSAGLTVFLLPFTIADSAPDGWGTPYIIAMIVVGFVMLFVFIFYEVYIAPVPLFNWKLLRDRTVIGACLLNATYQISYYCWFNYFTSFLQVVNDLTIAESGYVGNTFDVVSGLLLLGVGFLIRKTGRFKWLLYIAVPLYIFAQGLMIYFRRPNQSVGYLVMCQVFTSIGGSIFIIVVQLAILAAVDHQHVAATLGLLSVVGTVGNAIGPTICGAIWTNTFQPALIRLLPTSELENLDLIYEDLPTQLSYEVGSETRLAIQEAYGYAQTRMLAAGTGIMGLAIIWTFLIRDIDLKKVSQVKGTVF